MVRATLIPMNITISELRQLKPPEALPQELRNCTGFLLARVGIASKLAAMEEFEREGFSPYSYGVLAVLADGAKATQATIAGTLDLDRGQLVGILHQLEGQGLVERRGGPNDPPRRKVTL